MLNPQASTFSVGDGTPLNSPGLRNRSSGVATRKKSSGNVRVLADRGVASEDKSPLSDSSQTAFACSRETTGQQNPPIHDRFHTLPLTSGARTNVRNSDRDSLRHISSFDPTSPDHKHKNFRMEQDRHNLMGVASIWAPRPSEKDLHAVYPMPVLSPTPRKPSENLPSPRLSPAAPAFTSRNSPVWTGVAAHPMLLTVPQYMQPAFVAPSPSMQHHNGHPGSRDDRGFLPMDQLMTQAWFCPMCENENRHNTETCAHCEALNPNRSLIRAISQQQQHAQAFQAYPSGHFAVLPALSTQAKNLTSVSPMIIMSKLSCHVNAILQVGADGAKLQSMLVSGDVSLCYAMGMRGLVGKEAINPWKCVGVEIPSQNFIKNVSKPPLGTVAGDWTCSCGRENWAKRSVCSRCFPGIEPEYKSLVFSKVKPIFDFIAAQEQDDDAQKDAEWLAAEERRLRHGHLKQTQAQSQTQSTSHSGPVIGKEFVADSRPLRQASRSPSMPNAYSLEARPPLELASQFPYYPQTYAVHQGGPAMAAFGSIYPYPMMQPQQFQGYSRQPEEYAFQPRMQHGQHDQYSLRKDDIEPALSIPAASSSRFSMVESSESASDSHFSPFSRSGSQHAIPKLGFTVTGASSAGSVQTAGTSSTGRSFSSTPGRHLNLPENMLRMSEDARREPGPTGTQPDTANAFSPFSQPQLVATQASQARHRSAKKAELRPTRSVSPIGQGRPESSIEDHARQYPRQDTIPASDSRDSMQSATSAAEASYVNALGSLLKDVHF